ncbi:amino acid permease 8 [Dendrobium catenatum]|uniref:Amino acid permease 8 n=1 Tax=Dendrobium catenatum TaxID=906689 RepID=A0A2I0X527_9ASPA|nr:amino acid permease 8 [Dendrobium catenatum]PKU82997.1 Amino acid permease 8 [Dendrobium catenatum]
MERGRTGKDVEEGEHERKGTVWSASAHIVAAVIGSGVLALAWSMAQLGWVLGPLVILGFAIITYYTSTLLADCYRHPDPITGTINRVYIDAVRAYLGPREVFLCGCAQYINLWGTLVGYTITAAISMMAVQRSNCFHRNGHEWKCESSGNLFMMLFGVVQIVLSQFPSLENITWLSVVAVATSFAYSFIGLGLSTGKLISHGGFKGTLSGVAGSSHKIKTWNAFLSLGNVAFAYTFADVLIEIQDTLKSPPPERKTMKRATFIGIGLTTIFYLSLGCTGYGAFGNNAPGNILTGFGFFEPFWLVDIANICIVVHLLGAYQVYAQPIFGRFESTISKRWPEAKFLHQTYSVRVPFSASSPLSFTLSKLVLRSCLILLTTLVAMLVPFFNAVLGLLGALGFWPLSVYFPVNMHIAQKNIKRGNPKWILLQGLSLFCLLISIAASIGSMADIISSLKLATPFKLNY